MQIIKNRCEFAEGNLDLTVQKPGSVLWKKYFKKFAKFTGKHLCQGLLFNKVAGFRSVFL